MASNLSANMGAVDLTGGAVSFRTPPRRRRVSSETVLGPAVPAYMGDADAIGGQRISSAFDAALSRAVRAPGPPSDPKLRDPPPSPDRYPSGYDVLGAVARWHTAVLQYRRRLTEISELASTPYLQKLRPAILRRSGVSTFDQFRGNGVFVAELLDQIRFS